MLRASLALSALLGTALGQNTTSTTADPGCIPVVPPTGEPCPTAPDQSFVYPDPDHCSM